jgi:hypothetical protein
MSARTIRRSSAWIVFVMLLTALVGAGCGGADGGTDQPPAGGEATAEVGSALAGDPCTTAAQCNDGNPCTVDKCVKKACAYTNKSDGTACSDGNACTKSDTCLAGACAGGPAVVCAPPNQCQTASGCNPSTGRCVYLAKAGSACDDGNTCTQNDQCTASAAGVCRGTVRPRGSPCDDGNTCTVNDQCTGSAASVCKGTVQPNGSVCNDGNPNTAGDVCTAGVCAGVDHCVGVTCAASDQCHAAGTCDPSTGLCSNPTLTNGAACNDGNACTLTDTCQAGVCTGVGNPCLNGGSCALGSGGSFCTCPTGATGANCQTCAAGYTECANSCANTLSDVANCGQCGVACAGGQFCQSGICKSPAATHVQVNLPAGFSPAPGGSAAQTFTVSLLDSMGLLANVTGDTITIVQGGLVGVGVCLPSTGSCLPPAIATPPSFCCTPPTYAYTISGCALSQTTINGTATFSGCIFTGPSGVAVSGAILIAQDQFNSFQTSTSFDIGASSAPRSGSGCAAQQYSFLVSTRGFGCSQAGPPPSSTSQPSQPPNSYNQQVSSGVFQPVPANVLLFSPQGCDPVNQPANCTLATQACFELCFSNDSSCVPPPGPSCPLGYPSRGFASCNTNIDQPNWAECLQDAAWPTHHSVLGTQQGTISAGSGDCSVNVLAPTGDIVLVGTLGNHWQVSSFGAGYSSCVGTGGPNGDGVQPPDCSELEISSPSVVAGRPSCSDGLACPALSTAQGNGSATDVYTVNCVP